MAQKIADVLQPEGQIPKPGSKVGFFDSVSVGKAVFILGAGALAGLYALRRFANFVKSASGQDSDMSGLGKVVGEL